MRKNNKNQKHHYVPKFYMRLFSKDEGKNKVKTISKNNKIYIYGNKSIRSIAYEDNLYRINDHQLIACYEKCINKNLETPVSQSLTWEKLMSKKYHKLGIDDVFTLYLFVRHMQSRNIDNLQFIKSEHQRVKNRKYRNTYSEEEKTMHEALETMNKGVEKLFIRMSTEIEIYAKDICNTKIVFVKSETPLRTSSNPVLRCVDRYIPQECLGKNAKDIMWCPLGAHFGVLVSWSENGFALSEHVASNDMARYFNRLYLIQLTNKENVRHCIAQDEDLKEDIDWIGMKQYGDSTNKFII